ncbi:hypothetical protein ACFW4K_05725 [Nocardiopsis alba]|uniref:hypothetical protein n=1 Tax=Nocardiopsis alba TaxID=53437 RepID=UPI00366E58F9
MYGSAGASPSEVFWFTSEEHYIASLVVRHEPPEEDNGPSLRVIEKSGGVHDGRNPDGQLRLWIDTASVPSDG